jgi:hypothetical protein
MLRPILKAFRDERWRIAMKRSLLLSLALLVAPLGATFAAAAPASAEGSACYVDSSDGGLEPAPNFQTQDSCETMVHGYWL